MAYPTYLPLETAQLPPGSCFNSEQQRLNAYTSLQFITLPAGSRLVVLSPTQPTVEQQDSLWVQTDENNQPIQQFTFSNFFGVWLWPHPVPPEGLRRILWTGTAAQVDAIDGGNSNPVSLIDGPFWEIDAEWSDKCVIGVGATVAEGMEALVFENAPSPAYPAFKSLYFLKRTIRQYLLPQP